MDLKINNSPTSKNISFGKVIPIKQLLVKGNETQDTLDLFDAATSLYNVLTHTGVVNNGSLMRAKVAINAGDYKDPLKPSEGLVKVIMSFKDGMLYLLTGKDAKEVARAQSEILKIPLDPETGLASLWPDTLEKSLQLDKAEQAILDNPKARLVDGIGLIIHGTRVPRTDKIQITNLDFSA